MAISEVSQLLAEVSGDAVKRRVLDAQASAAANELRAALKKNVRPAEQAAALARLEHVASGCEDILVELDAMVPTSVFRNLLESSRVGTMRLLQYARLIARYFRADVHHTERLDVLTQRLLSQPRQDAFRELRPRAGTDAALAYIVGKAKAPENIRRSALEFFAKATGRVNQLDRIQDVFGGGLYLDVLGYKVSIRESLLDAEILRASAELNAALANRLVTLMGREGVSPKAIAEQMAAVEAQVAQVFASPEGEDGATQVSRAPLPRRASVVEGKNEKLERIERPERGPRAEKAEEKPAKEQVELLRPQHGLRLMAGLALAIVLAFGAGMSRRGARNANELIPLSPVALAALSPVLESGAKTNGEAAPMLVAQVAPSKWLLMDRKARVSSTEQLAEELKKENIETALLYQGETVVAQVNEGRVLFAQ